MSRAIEHRRKLHQIPEVGYDLPETQAYVAEALSRCGGKIETFSPSGVLCYFDFGKPETLALRSDMDALPILECTGLGFSSKHPGKMHACGHDAHMAMLLTVAEQIRLLDPPRNVLLIFQPAEESGNGASMIINAGALERYNVKQIFACHVDPNLPLGLIASKPGAFMPLTSELYVTVRGKSSHIARSEDGIDSMDAGARFLIDSKALIAQKYADVPHLYAYGRFESGTANNIISGETKICGALRAFSEKIFDEMLADIRTCADEIAAQTGAQFVFDVPRGYPPLINDAASFEKLRALSGSLAFRELTKPWLIAEDFACYLQRVPGAMFLLGLDSANPLHSAKLNLDESAMLSGIKLFLALIRDKAAQ